VLPQNTVFSGKESPMKKTSKFVAALSLALLGIGAALSATETRVKGAEILKHPIGDLALKYADALHGGGIEDAMKLASKKAQAKWKKLPASERAESSAFLKKMVPEKNELAAGIQAGGILIIEDSRATLNVVKVEQKSAKPGTVDSSSTTIALPFELEGGQWKVAQ
jgi:hypothetical protein